MRGSYGLVGMEWSWIEAIYLQLMTKQESTQKLVTEHEQSPSILAMLQEFKAWYHIAWYNTVMFQLG